MPGRRAKSIQARPQQRICDIQHPQYELYTIHHASNSVQFRRPTMLNKPHTLHNSLCGIFYGQHTTHYKVHISIRDTPSREARCQRTRTRHSALYAMQEALHNMDNTLRIAHNIPAAQNTCRAAHSTQYTTHTPSRYTLYETHCAMYMYMYMPSRICIYIYINAYTYTCALNVRNYSHRQRRTNMLHSTPYNIHLPPSTTHYALHTDYYCVCATPTL